MRQPSRAPFLWAVLLLALASLPATAVDPAPAASEPSAVAATAGGADKAGSAASTRAVQTVVAVSAPVALIEEIHTVTGWHNVTPRTSVGRAIGAVPRGFVLKKPGIYEIVIEGIGVYDLDDPTTDPESALLFRILAGGIEARACVTAARSASFRLADQAATGCTTRMIVDVRGKAAVEQRPRVFPRNSLVEFQVLPGDRPAGAETFAQVYVVITKLSD